MVAYCDGFVIILDNLVPPAITLTACEFEKYGKTIINNRPIIMAPSESYLPLMFEKAIENKLISKDTYRKEQERLFVNHGLKI